MSTTFQAKVHPGHLAHHPPQQAGNHPEKTPEQRRHPPRTHHHVVHRTGVVRPSPDSVQRQGRRRANGRHHGNLPHGSDHHIFLAFWPLYVYGHWLLMSLFVDVFHDPAGTDWATE